MQAVPALVVEVPEFIAGFLYEMTGNNHLLEIENCYSSSTVLEYEIKAGIQDIHHGGWDSDVQAALEFALVALQIPQILHTCENMDEDIAAIKEWASIFKDPTRLTAKVTKNVALHHTAIQEDIGALKTDAHDGKWFTSGEDLADLLTLAVGPIKPVYPTEIFGTTSSVSNSFMSYPDFVAGLVYGLIGESDLPELEGCVSGGEQVFADAEALLADLKAGDIFKVIKGVKPLINEAKAEVSTCENFSDDWAEVDAWLGQFKHPASLVEHASKMYALHHKAIQADIAAEKADWAAGNAFKAGVDTADAIVILVGPIEPVAPTQ